MALKPIRDDVYAAMIAALNTNVGYIWRGGDYQTGAQLSKRSLLVLARRKWVRLVHARTISPKTGQIVWEITGAWILRDGRSALRAEVGRREDPMPERLVVRRTRNKPAPATTEPTPTPTPTPVPTRAPAPNPAVLALFAAPARIPHAARLGGGVTARSAAALLYRTDRGPLRRPTADVDPFALIGSPKAADDDIPF